MNRYALAAAALGAATLALPAAAQTVIPVPEFRAIDLRGGGKVTIRHAPRQRVTLISGSLDHARIGVHRESLRLSPCERDCPRNVRFEVLVETPEVQAVAIHGGGAVEAEGAFRRQGSIAAAVSGGGRLDVRAVPAGSVAASVRGGGEILARPASSLAASVHGGGLIQYEGDPQVTSAVQGGGHVRRMR
jgi:hypothetical protein